MNETWRDVPSPGGVRLAVRDVRRSTEDEPPVLLMHGLASTQRIWDLVIPRLARRHRVVTFDARGHGLSSKPSSGYGFGPVVQDAAAVIRALRLQGPIVVGHSWGAMVALELAARRPRLASGVVMVDGGVFRMSDDFANWQEARERLAPPVLTGMSVDEFRRRLRHFLPDSVEVTERIEDIVLSVMRVDAGGAIHPRLSKANHFRILRAIWQQDPMRFYDRLRVPALAILARSDGPFQDAKRRAAARLRDSPVEVRWMKGIHDLPLQHPTALAGHIDRFAKVVGG